MKLGVYGGTFNPIHLGHVHLLREMALRLGLDRVLLIPANRPPHKEAEDLADGADRAAMCRLAGETVGEVPVEVSELELLRAGKSYTADTLSALKKQYPGETLYLLMGEDMFLTVDRWVRAEEIMDMAVLCACPRSGGMDRLLEKKKILEREHHARCLLEEVAYLPVSSTQVREAARAGRPLEGLVPPQVERYIRAHGLYGGKEETP